VSSFWACVQTAPAREAAAEHFLRLAGYGQIYLPRLRVVRRHQGRRIELRPALFPNYLFVFITGGQWWRARWTPNVTRLVTAGGTEPAHVPGALIESIRQREVNGAIELIAPTPLKPGARLKILTGPFVDHVAVLVRLKPRERIEALLQLLGAEQKVTLAKADVEVIN
jgi:transcription antitermination factor NusG